MQLLAGINIPNAFAVMAEEHPPSPKCEDDTHLFGRLRVKPAMMVPVKDVKA